MSDTLEIRPAMTANQWNRHLATPRMADGVAMSHEADRVMKRFAAGGDDPDPADAKPHRHALAALALHGQDFGFSWEDVEKLRAVARTIEGEDAPLTAARVSGIADRIAALLPPREGDTP